MDDYKLDSPLIDLYYKCIVQQFTHVVTDLDEEIKEEEKINTFYGGAKDKEIDDEIKEIAVNCKGKIVEFVKKHNICDGLSLKDKYDIIKGKTQLVAGINYFIKICIGNG